ncbi:MAG TPA: tetratricopeptide repeat protein [Planctomycetes bacterium]|nr:tetratricopeptide repeat protein [Planctomycetota bacterium]
MQFHPSTFLLAGSLVFLGAGCGGGDEQAPSGAGSDAPAAAPAATAESGADAAAQIFAMGVRAAKLGKTEEAIADYRRALELDPDHVESHFALGCALVPSSYSPALGSSTRDFKVLDEAIGHLQKALAARPDDATFQYWTGRALDLRGRDEEAIACLRRAVELDPDYGAAYKRLGLVLVESGEIDAAKEAFERVRETMPDDPGGRFQLGNLYLEEDPEHAAELYREGIAIDPYYPWCYNGLAQALAALGDVEGAADAKAELDQAQAVKAKLDAKLDRALKSPTDFNAQFDVAEMYQAVGQDERALEMYRRALDLDPESAPTHYACGVIMENLENWDAAMNHFEEALYLQPTDIAARIELIRVSNVLGNTARAEELAEGLADMVRSLDVAAREAAAEVLLDTSKKEEGVALLEAIVKENPDDAIATQLLERAAG